VDRNYHLGSSPPRNELQASPNGRGDLDGRWMHPDVDRIQQIQTVRPLAVNLQCVERRCEVPEKGLHMIARIVLLVVLFFAMWLLFATQGVAATLDWLDNSNNESGFQIERMVARCTAPDAFTKIGDVGQNIKTYLDATTAAGNYYCYRVRAWNLKFANDPTSVQYSGYTNKGEIGYPLPQAVDPSQLGVTP